MYVYVASSWRNPIHIGVCAALKSAGIDHYDFRNPTPVDQPFHWSSIMSGYKNGDTVGPDTLRQALGHPLADTGYRLDFEAMEKADTFVLALPCGRSAHLELGWAAGQGKQTAVLLDQKNEPELMYKMVDYLAPSLFDLLGWLGAED